MHLKRDNIDIMINDEADEVIKDLFDSLKNRYQNNLESIKDSKFVLDYVHLLCYKCHKINLNHGGSYIDSPDSIENKKSAINHINKKDKQCFQYDVTVALNHGEIKKDPQRITKINTFINKYNYKGINFPSEKDECMKIDRNIRTTALNVSYAKKETIYTAYVSKHISNHDLKWRRMALSCSKKSINIFKKNNVERIQ